MSQRSSANGNDLTSQNLASQLAVRLAGMQSISLLVLVLVLLITNGGAG